MCKRINRFIPVLFISYIGLSILAGIVIGVMDINMPIWGSYLISQAIVLLPALVYVAVHKINIIAVKNDNELNLNLGGDYVFDENDHLVVLGKSSDVFSVASDVKRPSR